MVRRDATDHPREFRCARLRVRGLPEKFSTGSLYTRRVQGSDAAVEGTTPRRGRPKTAGLQEARRKAIVSAAFAVFTQKGYDDTSIADIAAHAGIGHGTIYRYFTSKREILDHVFDFAVEKTVHALSFEELTLALADREQARELVETVGTRLFELVDREPGLLKLITVQCSAIDPELRERVTGCTPCWTPNYPVACTIWHRRPMTTANGRAWAVSRSA